MTTLIDLYPAGTESGDRWVAGGCTCGHSLPRAYEEVTWERAMEHLQMEHPRMYAQRLWDDLVTEW